MAAKLLHSLADENSDLQKQIGCMTGILQLFDRPHMIASRRMNQKMLPPPGTSQFNKINVERNLPNVYIRQAADDINFHKSVNEKQRVSTESSRASFSSSCSSSMSSLECSKAAQPEPSSFDRIIFPETPSRDPMINQSSTTSTHLFRHSTDLKDVVKDSMNREARGLSVKTSSKEEAIASASKRKDSPRPLPLDKNQTVQTDLKESLRVLAKLQEAPWHFHDAREVPGPRFSCDGREVNRLSFESRETIKSSLKLKEFRRLSLDSREGSILRNNRDMGEKVENLPQSSGTQSRPTSVVAKLMGLEALPDSATSTSSQLASMKSGSIGESDPFIRPLKTKELMLPIRGFNKSPRGAMKEPTSPRWKSHEKVMKPISRSPNEPAPWKQMDGNRNLQKAVPKPIKVPEKSASSSHSVYGEIERRLKDIEFKQSGKDLRALKQILEAIQAKGLLETRKEEQPSNFGMHKDYEQRGTTPSKNLRLENQKNPRRGSSSRAFESPIVIMKPAKLVEKYGLNNSVVSENSFPTDAKKVAPKTRKTKDQTPKTECSDKKTSGRIMRSSQPSSKPHKTPKESSSSSIKGSGSVSPRLQQKKLELERCSRPPTPPDRNRSRKQPSQAMSEFTSPGGRRRPKYLNQRPSDDQLSEVSNESRTLSCQGDDLSVHSDGNNASDCDPMQKSILRLGEEDEPLAELASGAAEHQSPVSVLDVSGYTDGAASPLKEESNSFKDEGVGNSIPEDSSSPGPVSEINRKKLQNIDQLVQKLRRLNSTYDEERTDYIASLCENTNPDHRYISEILVASGLLLRDLSPNSAQFQLHPSGHPINPELFFVLEQTKTGAVMVPCPEPDPEKARRRLIFDSVNEILVQKLSISGVISEPRPGPKKLARKTLTAQKLLKELCHEIEELENKQPECALVPDKDDPLKGILWEDVMDRSDGWNDFHAETSGIVLDIERSIFKDLVNEVLIGESRGMRARPGRRRQLFSK
ncbi:protein LONGIFOLIA 1 [Punica granatum]|uniref:Uncharacterized protein n=2 Tax=Punica granatum TaxID=22663 RepID=A0A218VXC8_PUNGR|nr:protein LONGIFOLIA 1 [Punica granatum]OWM65224.1 hypothetical protein CDL15_Pgr008813 [Punica granatum]PKI47729.1 hypothetical protein CRG98_031862 [Punica granatum]